MKKVVLWCLVITIAYNAVAFDSDFDDQIEQSIQGGSNNQFTQSKYQAEGDNAMTQIAFPENEFQDDFEPAKIPKDQTPVVQKVKYIIIQQKEDQINFVVKFSMEIFLVSLLLVCIFNFFIGKRANNKLAMSWIYFNKPYFEQNFALVGFDGAQRSKEQKPKVHGHCLEQTSYTNYIFYASGRLNIRYCLVELELGKRHDILSYLVLSLLWPSSDRVSIEIGLDYTEPVSPLCFAIVPIKKMKNILNNTADLKRLTTPKQSSWLQGTEFTLLVENDDALQHFNIIKDEMKHFFKHYAKFLTMVHFTDRKIFTIASPSARFDFIIPRQKQKFLVQQVTNAIHTLIYLVVDHFAAFKMSRQKQQTANDMREKMVHKENQKRIQEIQKKKDQKRLEQMKSKQRLSGVEQAKLDEKEKARQKKKMMKKRFKMVKA